MRIDRLFISRFKNLRDLTIDFDESSLSTVLLGRNGTGKSNLLEALVVLFRDLDLRQRPSFAYTIRYACRGQTVEIDADPARTSRHTVVRVDGKAPRVRRSRRLDFLPNHVFGYYSGPSNRLERHFERHQDVFKRQLIRADAAERPLPLRPLFYARSVHSQFVLLAFFVDQRETTRRFLEEYLNIIGLESVLFVMKAPDWKREPEDRFWGAKGIVRVFLERLYGLSLAPIRKRPGRPDERLYLFIRDIQALQALFKEYGTQTDFFKTLESTYISELIEDLRIRVTVKGMDTPLTFSELSEGEQQLLTVLGLLRFTNEDDSLFLLDEPDTHLNPAWSLEYLRLLSAIVGEGENSHIIIATHDPLMLGGLTKSQVQVLFREEDGRISAKQPDEDPKGMGVAALLTSELFGLRSTLDLDTLEKLDRKRKLAVQTSLTGQEKADLETLSDELGNLDFTKTARDPLYQAFVEAMTRSKEYQDLKKPTLTPDEGERLRVLADRVVGELESREPE